MVLRSEKIVVNQREEILQLRALVEKLKQLPNLYKKIEKKSQNKGADLSSTAQSKNHFPQISHEDFLEATMIEIGKVDASVSAVKGPGCPMALRSSDTEWVERKEVHAHISAHAIESPGSRNRTISRGWDFD